VWSADGLAIKKEKEEEEEEEEEKKKTYYYDTLSYCYLRPLHT
jgi:hypothetical protein